MKGYKKHGVGIFTLLFLVIGCGSGGDDGPRIKGSSGPLYFGFLHLSRKRKNEMAQKWKKVWGCSALAILLTFVVHGCAFRSQTANVMPQIRLDSEKIGRGKTVKLSVIDEREDKNIGRRAYKGSDIHLSQDI